MPSKKKKTSSPITPRVEVALRDVGLRAAARNYAEVADLEVTDPRWVRRARELRRAAFAYADAVLRQGARLPLPVPTLAKDGRR